MWKKIIAIGSAIAVVIAAIFGVLRIGRNLRGNGGGAEPVRSSIQEAGERVDDIKVAELETERRERETSNSNQESISAIEESIGRQDTGISESSEAIGRIEDTIEEGRTVLERIRKRGPKK